MNLEWKHDIDKDFLDYILILTCELSYSSPYFFFPEYAPSYNKHAYFWKYIFSSSVWHLQGLWYSIIFGVNKLPVDSKRKLKYMIKNSFWSSQKQPPEVFCKK